MDLYRVASFQFCNAPADKEANLQMITRFVRKAAAKGVRILCCPECCNSGYWHLQDLPQEQIV